MLFANGGAKGLALDLATCQLEVVDVVDGDWQAAGVIVHDVKNRSLAHMLIELPFGAFPMALGVLYDDPRPTFESAVVEQNAKLAAGKVADLQKLVSRARPGRSRARRRPMRLRPARRAAGTGSKHLRSNSSSC